MVIASWSLGITWLLYLGYFTGVVSPPFLENGSCLFLTSSSLVVVLNFYFFIGKKKMPDKGKVRFLEFFNHIPGTVGVAKLGTVIFPGSDAAEDSYQ